MSDGRLRAAAQGAAPSGGAPSCRGSERERRGDVPVLRHQSPGVLQVAAPLRRGRRGGPAGPVVGTVSLAERNEGGGGRQDYLSASALPLRSDEDFDVLEALSRRRD